ncbi:MAG TPA: glycerophosphodiester phosphodiesterase family protein, partial [Pseudomonadales bacterium]|nr:glycerophosphodiester phosphodiesterase family protein [Pseudomonadales bacterium]
MRTAATLPAPDHPAFGDRFLCVGHRGASGLAPENTLAAFERALELGVDAIELDVHRCEGELVVIHDDDLARTTSGRGRVAETPLAAVRQVDAGDGQRVPLLTEVLDLVGETVLLNIELKGVATAGPVVDLLRARGADPQRYLLSAFDHAELHAARAAAPEFPRGALFGRLEGDPVSAARAVDAVSVNLARRTVRAAPVEAIRAAGLGVLVYTVNDSAEALRFA